MTGAPDLANLLRFLAHLGERDAGAAGLASQLLDDGWTVESFLGPEQMDVWQLVLRRGSRAVRFGIERGYVDGVAVAGDADAARRSYRSLPLAVLGWARSTGTALVFDDPDAFRTDLAAFGRPAIEWLDAGNDEVHERIVAAQRAHFSRRHGRDAPRDPDGIREVTARGIREIEDAAAPGAC